MAATARSIVAQQSPVADDAYEQYLQTGLFGPPGKVGQPDPSWAGNAGVSGYIPGGTAMGGAGSSGISGAFAGNAGGTPNDFGDLFFDQQDNSPDMLYRWQQPQGYTLQDYSNAFVAPALNNWLMGSYFNALPSMVNETNDAWAQQLNINAQNQFRNNLLGVLAGAFGGLGNGNGGFRDTNSGQQANMNGTYSTTINAGGLNPEVAQGAVNALTNSHPGGPRGNQGFTDPQSQRADLRRMGASHAGNELGRFLDQGYAQQQGNMEARRANEGLGLQNYLAGQQIRQNAQRAQLAGAMIPLAQRRF